MKAFEKWEDKIWQKTGCGPQEPCGSCKVLRKEGWRAALEWLNKKAAELNFSKIGLDICTLHDVIQKELGKK